MLTIPPVVAPVVAEPTTPIKPSEALRLGRLLRPRQVSAEFWDGTDGACALGSMLAAVGGQPSFTAIERHFPSLSDNWLVNCPEAFCRGPYRYVSHDPVTVTSVVWHLNDAHHWSDDQIIPWLESLGL